MSSGVTPPINTSVINTIEPVEPNETIAITENKEKSGQEYISDFLKALQNDSQTGSFVTSEQLTVGQIIFGQLLNLTEDTEISLDLLHLADALFNSSNENSKEIKDNKINDFFYFVSDYIRAKGKEELYQYIKEVLLNCTPEELNSSLGSFLSESKTKSYSLLHSALDFGCSFYILRKLYSSSLKPNIFKTERLLIQSLDKFELNTNKLYAEPIVFALKDIYIGRKGELSQQQVYDLLTFYDKFETFCKEKNDDFVKTLRFYVSNITKTFGRITLGDILSPEENEDVLNVNHLVGKLAQMEEIIDFFKEFKDKCIPELEELSFLFEARYILFYYFYSVKTEELIDILNKSKNSTALFKNLSKAIFDFNKKVQIDLRSNKFPDGYFKCFNKNKFVYEYRLLSDFFAKICLKRAQDLKALFYIDNGTTLSIFNAVHLKINSSYSSNSMALQSKQEMDSGDEISELGQLDEDQKSTNSALQESKIRPLRPVKKREILYSLNQKIQTLTSAIQPQFSLKPAKKHAENAEFYFLNLIIQTNRLANLVQNPASRLQIADLFLKFISCIDLGIEQFLTARVAEEKNCATFEALALHLNVQPHNILHLCDLITYPICNKDYNLIQEINKSDLNQRDIPSLIATYDPDGHHVDIKKLHEMAYRLSLLDPKVDVQELLANCIKYYKLAMDFLINVVKDAMPKEQLNEVEEALDDSLKILKNLIKNIKLSDKNDYKQQFPELENFLAKISALPAKELNNTALSSLASIQFLLKRQNYNMSSLSDAPIEEMPLIYSNILQCNQIIFEQFLYLLLDIQGKDYDRAVIRHDLTKLINDELGYTLKLSTPEKDFLIKSKTILTILRYKSDIQLDQVKKAAKNHGKKGKAKKRTDTPKDFTGVNSNASKKEKSQRNQTKTSLLAACDVMKGILGKLFSCPEYQEFSDIIFKK